MSKEREHARCKNAVQRLLTDAIVNYSIDFANLVYMDRQYQPPSYLANVSSYCPHVPLTGSRRQHIVLLYDTRHWMMLGDAKIGCLCSDGQRWPYIVQGFAKDTGAKLLVVAAYFTAPHNYLNQLPLLKLPWLENDVTSAKRELRIFDVLLIAGTNLNSHDPSWEVMEGIGAAPVEGASVQTTSAYATCCYPNFRFGGKDRVVANFGRSMKTIIPFSKSALEHIGTPKMHLAVIGSLNTASHSGSQSSSRWYCTFLLLFTQIGWIIK